ncbi:DUF647-domain-containing protein [Panus rudis PR-1116 ss-1]|nr:DUF647-domain-containing protein [Panus rudis PR-1116 ss-1]
MLRPQLRRTALPIVSRLSSCYHVQLASRCSRAGSYRCQSTKAPSSPDQDTKDASSPRSSVNGTQPFAIQHVSGREQFLSWSPQGTIKKEWRNAGTNIVEQTPSRATTAFSGLKSRFKSWFMEMFLPTNYPQSVHRSYAPYHILQFAETILGTLVSVLCNQALLSSVGMSAEASVFGAVAVQWIIKDGAGEVAKLFFIRRFSPYFDSHPKTFSLLGESAVLLGSGLQIATVLVNPTPVNFLLCAAGGNIFKLIGNAIWLTTHIKFVRYFSQQGNTGDVAAKAESQASVAQLLGYAGGIGLLTLSHSPAYLYGIFFVALPLHLFVTTYMLHLTKFELLTLPRLSRLAKEFAKVSTRVDGNSARIPKFDEMEKASKTGPFGEFYKRRKDRFISLVPKLEDVVTADSADKWEMCAKAFQNENYLLYPPASLQSQPISIFYSPAVSTEDMLRSILHAARLRQNIISAQDRGENPEDPETLRDALVESSEWTNDHFPEFRHKLEEAGWRMDEIAFADHGRRVIWNPVGPTPA